MPEYLFRTYKESTYQGFVCFVCFKTMSEAPLKKCASCKLIFYCSKEHQTYHWPRHKEFCKSIRLLFKNTDLKDLFANALTSEKKVRKSILYKLTVMIESHLKRRMVKDEYYVFNNPFVCNVCCTDKAKEMIVCKGCSTTAYCCEEHERKDAASHSLSCKELKKKLEYLKHFRGEIIISAKVKEFIKLPPDMKSFLDEVIITNTTPQVQEKLTFWYFSEIFTIPLTVIYAIEKGLSGNTINKDNFTVHVVGCRQFENSALATWQYIFHHFKMLNSLDIIYIGPETSSTNYLLPPMLYCMDCEMSKKKINFKMDPVPYHDYIKKDSRQPDIVIAFHCGFYDYKCLMKDETWKDSMLPLCSFPGSVTAFTSYNEREGKEDLKIFKEACASDKLKFLVESELNPYRNLLPTYNIDTEEFSYENCYITVVKCL